MNKKKILIIGSIVAILLSIAVIVYAATKSIAEELNLTTPVICYQGGLIKNFYQNNDTILENTISEKLARTIIKELKLKNIFFNLYDNDILMVEQDNELIQEYANKRNIK